MLLSHETGNEGSGDALGSSGFILFSSDTFIY